MNSASNVDPVVYISPPATGGNATADIYVECLARLGLIFQPGILAGALAALLLVPWSIGSSLSQQAVAVVSGIAGVRDGDGILF